MNKLKREILDGCQKVVQFTPNRLKISLNYTLKSTESTMNINIGYLCTPY